MRRKPTDSPVMFGDLTAPRFRRDGFARLFIDRDLYKLWLQKTNRKDISYDMFRQVWSYIADAIQDAVEEDRMGVRLPSGLGVIYMAYVPSKRRPIDYKTSRALGKYVYYENWDTQGKLGKIVYTHRDKYRYRTHKLWGFKPLTRWKRRVSMAFQRWPERYINSLERMYTHAGQSNNRGTHLSGEGGAEEG